MVKFGNEIVELDEEERNKMRKKKSLINFITYCVFILKRHVLCLLSYRFSFFFYADKGLLIAHKYISLILSSNVNQGLDSKRKYFYCSIFVFLRPITAIIFFIKNLFPYAYACRSFFCNQQPVC